jgi:hypothetical protein
MLEKDMQQAHPEVVEARALLQDLIGNEVEASRLWVEANGVLSPLHIGKRL